MSRMMSKNYANTLKGADSNLNVNTTHDSEKFLEFEVSGKQFAYHIKKVAEIMEYPDVEPLPWSPDFFLGAINLRGDVIPIVDLATCLGLEPQPVTKKSCVVISEIEHQDVIYQVGNKVDLVTRVIDITSDQIEVAPDLAGQLEHRVLIGLAKLDSRLLTILDIDNLLSQAQLEWFESQRTRVDIDGERVETNHQGSGSVEVENEQR